MSKHDSPAAQRQTSRLRRLRLDARGALMLEYSILVGTVALACAVGLLVVGIAVLNSFGFVRELLLSAIP
jgi:Flp pilus assembly pilin Flp